MIFVIMQSTVVKSSIMPGGELEELIAQYQRRPEQARYHNIIEITQPLVSNIARKFKYRGEPLEDLEQVGSIGLMKAVQNYKSTKGATFNTYATTVIMGEIKHYFRDHNPLIKIPRQLHERSSYIHTIIKDLTAKKNSSPTVKDLVKFTKLSEEEVLECLSMSERSRLLSLDAPLGAKNSSVPDNVTLMEAITSQEKDIMETIINRQSMQKAMDTLDKKEKKVVYYSYYMNLKQSEIADKLNYSQAHVSRILVTSLSKLRENLKS